MEIKSKKRMKIIDKTFYVRLLSHLEQCTPGCQMGMEELEYLKHVARKHLQHQIDTVEEGSEEYNYLKNLNLI